MILLYLFFKFLSTWTSKDPSPLGGKVWTFCWPPSPPSWVVSSTPFRVPFHVLVRFWNRGIISIIICKWSVQNPFQQYFSIISKSVCYDFYLERNVAFTLISFDVLKWDDCLSVQLPFELPVQVPVQLLLELELNWLVQNVIELEFELSRM